MWWNFIERSHANRRAEWQAQIAPAGEVVADSQQMSDGRFEWSSATTTSPRQAARRTPQARG
jgi:hypothetical protein